MNIPLKRFSDYTVPLKNAWQLLWQKPVVFVPAVYQLVLLLLVVLGIASVMANQEITLALLQENIPFIIGFLIVLMLIIFHVLSLQIAIYTKAISKKKLVFRTIIRESFMRYGRVALTSLLFLVIAAAIFGIIRGVFGIISLFLNEKSFVWILIIIVGLLAIIGFVIALFFSAWMIFWMPLVGTTKSPIMVIKKAWTLLWKDPHHVWITYLIKLGITFSITIILSIVSARMRSSESWWIIVELFSNAILMTWLSLFVFSCFFSRYKVKVE